MYVGLINAIGRIGYSYESKDLLGIVNVYGLLCQTEIPNRDSTGKRLYSQNFTSEDNKRGRSESYPSMGRTAPAIYDVGKLLEYSQNTEDNLKYEYEVKYIERQFSSIGEIAFFQLKFTAVGEKYIDLTGKDLISALKLFIMDTILKGGYFETCANCGSWFVVKDKRGKSAKTCSGKCRTEKFRGRIAGDS